MRIWLFVVLLTPGCIVQWSVGTPTSCDKPVGRANSGSSREQSDDEDVDTEAGPCEQSTDSNDLKRKRRCVVEY